MGNNAINHTALVKEENGKYVYRIETKSLELMGLKGEVTNVFVYRDHKAKVREEAAKEAVTNGEYNQAFTVTCPNQESQVWVAVWVSAMDELAGGGPGSGEQDAYLAFAWDQSKALEGEQTPKQVEAPATNAIKVMVNGKEVTSDVAPFIENDRTLVPVRMISEALGVEVKWDNDRRQVQIQSGDVQATLTIGEAKIVKNGEDIVIDQPAQIKDSRTFVPIRAIAELLDAKVDWNGEARAVEITK